jgi:mercuric ion binding protein
MIRQIPVALALMLMLSPFAVRAAEKTVMLDVKNADCVLCPPIVRESLMRVSGVKTVAIKQANQMADFMAMVTFDDAVTNADTLIAATTNAGYPSHLVN